MTDAVQIALISSLAAVVGGAVPGTLAAISASAARRAAERSQQLSHETKEVTVATGKAVDGRLDEMLRLTRAIALIEGGDTERKRAEEIAAAVKDSKMPSAITRQEHDAGD